MDDHLCSTTADRLPGEMLCWIEVDLDAIADNVRALQAAAQPRQGVAAAAHAAGETCKVQVKVDTGMTRYGAPPDEAMAIVRGLRNLPSLELEGFYTHFAAADDPDPFFAHQQLARFLAICQQLESEGLSLGIKHAANSAGALRGPGAGLDTIRAGIPLAGAHAPRWGA